MHLLNFVDSIISLLNNNLTNSEQIRHYLIPLDNLKPEPNRVSTDRHSLNSDRKNVCNALKIKGTR